MQSTNPFAALIAGALAGGHNRASLMQMAGCSRMQFWRLENGLSGPRSRAGKKLEAALSVTRHAAIDDVVKELSQRLAAAEPSRRADAIDMLHAVTRLLT